MKVIKEDIELEKSKELTKSTQFRATSAGIIRLIEIASKDMYKNPIQSMLTEYVQNAIDAHVVAGIPEIPIEITMPTKFIPNYKVRDFGSGMHPDEIENIYGAIGESTKKDSNDLLGAFGMGKLVFAAYSGIMNLVSFYRGTKYSYFCRIQNGEGEITPVDVCSTDEPDGLLIDIPIRNADIDICNRTASMLYSFLEPRPIINNGDSFKYYNLKEEALVKDGFIITNDASTFSTMSCSIGNLPFPLSSNDIQIDSTIRQAFNKVGLILRFKIGEVDIVSSRDSLRYSERTIEAVNSKISIVLDSYIGLFQEMVDKCTSPFNVQRLIMRSFDDGNITLLRKKQVESVTWRGIDFPLENCPAVDVLRNIPAEERQAEPHEDKLNLANTKLHTYYYGTQSLSQRGKRDFKRTVIPREEEEADCLFINLNYQTRLTKDLNKKTRNHSYLSTIARDCKIAFKTITEKNPVHYVTKLKTYFTANTEKAFYVITCTPYVKSEIIKFMGLQEKDYIDNLNEFVKALPDPAKVTYCPGTKTKPQKGPRKLDKVSTVSLLKLDTKGLFNGKLVTEYKGLWNPVEEYLKTITGVYAPIENFRFANCGYMLNHSTQSAEFAPGVDSLVRFLTAFTPGLNIYGVRRDVTVVKGSKLVALNEHITKVLQTLLQPNFKDLLKFIIHNAEVLMLNTHYPYERNIYGAHNHHIQESGFVYGLIKEYESKDNKKILEPPKALKQFWKSYNTAITLAYKTSESYGKSFAEVIQICNTLLQLADQKHGVAKELIAMRKAITTHNIPETSALSIDLHNCSEMIELFGLYAGLPCRSRSYLAVQFSDAKNLNVLNGINVLLKQNKLIK